MKIRHTDLVIDEKKPFANCQLGRKKFGDALTSIVQTYADGFVLAINNEWGTGKTTFVKMWEQSLKNLQFRTLYFNAWEHDFDHDPIVAVLSELKSLTKKDSPAFGKILIKAGTLSKHLIPILVRAVADKYIVDTKGIGDAFEKLSEEAIDILDSEIKEYSQKKDTLQSFKMELEKYVKDQCGGKPLVFIIDELDRCRPNYAVEVLEKVKHFFSVPGIVFVLSIDKEQLGHAVKGVYGSAGMNSDEYLRRFIDLEFELPSPNPEMICDYLFNYFGFREFFQNDSRISAVRPTHSGFLTMSYFLFSKRGVTLRQQEKIFAHARAILLTLSEQYATLPELLITLIYLRTITPSLFHRIKAKSLSLQSLVSNYADFLTDEAFDSKEINFVYLEAEIVFLYHKSISSKKEPLIKINSDNQKYLSYSPYFDKSSDTMPTIEFLEGLSKEYVFRWTSLDKILSRIELTEDLSS